MWEKIRENKNLKIFLREILGDILIVILVALFLSILAELLLPGIVSERIGLEKVVISLLIVILLQSFLPEDRVIQTKKEKALTMAFGVIGLVLFLGFFWKMGWIFGLVFSVLSLLASWGVAKLFLNKS